MNDSFRSENLVDNQNRITLKAKVESSIWLKSEESYKNNFETCFPKEHYNELLRKLSKQYSECWKLKRKYDLIRNPKWFKFVAWSAILLSLTFIIMLLLASLGYGTTLLVFIGLLLLGVALSMVISVSISNFMKVISEFQTLGRISKQLFEPIIAEYHKLFPQIEIIYNEEKYTLTITKLDRVNSRKSFNS